MRQRPQEHGRTAVCYVVVWLGATFGASLICLNTLSAETKPKPVDTTVRISSVPSGAYVMICPGGEFDDKQAVGLGKTPLLRLMPLLPEGQSIQISKPGFGEWGGRLGPGAAEIKAQLVPLTAEQKQARGFFVSPPFCHLTVVPIRLGAHKLGAGANAPGPMTDTGEFRNRFLNSFAEVLERRFSTNAVVRDVPEFTTTDFWQSLESQLKDLRLEKVGFNPVPVRLNFSPEVNSQLAEVGGGVLLMRGEAQYRGGGAVFARSLVPLVLSAGSAYAGYTTSVPGSFYSYTLFGPLPAADLVVAQLLVVHSETRELLWSGQVIYPQYFKHKGVTEETARKAAEQIPAALLKRP